MIVNKQILKDGHKLRPFFASKSRTGKHFKKTSITIHSTGNATSTAHAELNWLNNKDNNRIASWHYVIDQTQCIQAIPDDEEAWHAGKTEGNCYSLGLEICESGDRLKTLNNAVDFVVKKCKEYGWTIKNIKKHYDWTSKDCPRILINPAFIKTVNGIKLDYNWFINEIDKKLNKKPVVEDWKVAGINYLYENKLLNDKEGWTEKIDEQMPTWAVTILLMNIHKDLKKKMNSEEEKKERVKPSISEDLSIFGETYATAEELTAFIKRINKDFNTKIAEAFIKFGKKYGIRGDVAICQSIHETGWFKFENSIVLPAQNNFSGLGATNPVEQHKVILNDTLYKLAEKYYTTVQKIKELNGLTSDNLTVGMVLKLPKPLGKGNWFKTIEDGVEAQIQHLWAYATKKPLPDGTVLKDVRFNLANRGSSENWLDLGGKWAWPGYNTKKYKNIEDAKKDGETYGNKIINIYKNLINFIK